MIKHSTKVFGYVDKTLKARVTRLRKMNSRLSQSRLVEEGLQKVVEFYEAQHPTKPTQSPSTKLKSV